MAKDPTPCRVLISFVGSFLWSLIGHSLVTLAAGSGRSGSGHRGRHRFLPGSGGSGAAPPPQLPLVPRPRPGRAGGAVGHAGAAADVIGCGGGACCDWLRGGVQGPPQGGASARGDLPDSAARPGGGANRDHAPRSAIKTNRG
ncbi:Krueppel-like factor 14 [Malurus melanocephalus]|uniref:Krueppel-like factor 14 n=1 Tax=Malurus melanocephalus TaxID=175006 RepID=UPI0025475007|nr:Krueppel-like factor 14 [Malurus melanocephalus]